MKECVGVRQVFVRQLACSAEDAFHNAEGHCVVEFMAVDMVHPKSPEGQVPVGIIKVAWNTSIVRRK